MARPTGTRNPGFAGRREKLLTRLHTALVVSGPPPSLRSLAAAAGVSIPTLRHYFGDRAAILGAVYENARADGREPLSHVAQPQGSPLESVEELLRFAWAGLEQGGVGSLHGLGLREGLADPAAARGYRNDVLEPTLDAFAERLAAHHDANEMVIPDPRRAAVQLLGPLLLAWLHQHPLGGDSDHEIDVDELLTETAAAFVRGHGG